MKISEMQDYLSQCGQIARAFDAAGKLADGLANVEQVGKELDVANEAKRKDLADAVRKLDTAKAKTEKAEQQAAEAVQAAEAKAVRIRETAQADADKQAGKLLVVLEKLQEQIETAQAELGSLTQTVEAKKAELGRIEKRLADAQEAARKAFMAPEPEEPAGD